VARKREITGIDDPREIIPQCIITVTTHAFNMHMSKAVTSLQEIRRRYPNPEGVPYTDYLPSCIID
jgi:hypothetical protein